MSDDRAPFGQLEVTNALGMKLLLPVASVAAAYRKMRELGASGWSTGEPPAGGYILPYAMADTFDFALIGAREFAMQSDGETVRAVEHRGKVYTRREAAAITKGKKMPARIWYSRGAKAHDGATKDDDGAISYVCLISFVGGGRSIAEFERPKAGAALAPQPAAEHRGEQAPQAARPAQARTDADVTRDLADRFHETPLPIKRKIEALAKSKGLSDAALLVIIDGMTNFGPLSEEGAQMLFERVRGMQVGA